MNDAIHYVYGVTLPTLELGRSPQGLDESPLGLEIGGGLAAVVSQLDPATYAPDAVEQRTSDVEWLGPRAMVHDRVLTWVSDQLPVVPFPMFSAMFRDAPAVQTMLRTRGDELRRALDIAALGREYGLRVYRDDAALMSALATMSPRIADLEQNAATATPGQRYLMERKLDEERKVEIRRVSEDVAREVYDTMGRLAVRSRRMPLPRDAAARASLTLNAVFLVAPEAYTSFRGALEDIRRRLEPAGLRFEFTGPWPAYHFVEDSTESDTSGPSMVR